MSLAGLIITSSSPSDGKGPDDEGVLEVVDRDGPEVRGPEEKGQVLDEDRDPDGHEDLGQMVGIERPPDEERVGDEAHDKENRCGQDDGHVGVQAEIVKQPEGDVHGEHEELAVREIDDLHDPVDQGQADAGQGIDSPQQDAGHEQLNPQG